MSPDDNVAPNDPCCCREDLFKEFGIKLSFVATRSGLTRWEEHKEEPKEDHKEEHTKGEHTKEKDEFEMDDDYDPDNPREP